MKHIRELKEADVELDSMISELERDPLQKKLLMILIHLVWESLMTRRYMKKSHQISTLTKRKQDKFFPSLQKVDCPTCSFRECLYIYRNRKGVISSLNDLLASQFHGRCQKGLLIYTPYT